MENGMPPSYEFLTADQAASVLHKSKRTLERYRITGEGPRFVKAGRRILYPLKSIQEWAEQRLVGSHAEARSKGF
jgi:predicted DNA-binding transcriptional regulator AlpA